MMNDEVTRFEVLLEEWLDRVPLQKTVGPIETTELLKGNQDTNFHAILATAVSTPSKQNFETMHRDYATRGIPTLILAKEGVGLDARYHVYGPSSDSEPLSGLGHGDVELLLQSALTADTVTELHRGLADKLRHLRSPVAKGQRNEGLFADRVLGLIPQERKEEWVEACAEGLLLRAARGTTLLEGLGFDVDHRQDHLLLRSTKNQKRRALAVVLERGQAAEDPQTRFANTTAVAHGFALARAEDVEWLIVTGASFIRLYPISPENATGQKGQSQTFFEIDLELLSESNAGYLTWIFSGDSLGNDNKVAQLLAASKEFAFSIAERLRDRVYEEVVPGLARAVARAMGVSSKPPDEQEEALDAAYRATMIILFRLLFVAYCEDRRYLPFQINTLYTDGALETMAMNIRDNPDIVFDKTSTALWQRLLTLWDVVANGSMTCGVPAYNGGLFTRDANRNPIGAFTFEMQLSDNEIGPVLKSLLTEDRDGVRSLVDFRDLSVREFGTIYEGLLESSLAIASVNLKVDEDERYAPTKKASDTVVKAGEVFVQTGDGERKMTSSYFTKPFAVDHLINQTIDPVLDDHLAEVEALITNGEPRKAAEKLWNFKVADLAMGSAHFLVASVDHLESRLTGFLSKMSRRGLKFPELVNDLEKLRTAASVATPIDTQITDTALLRRMIARRMIFGVDRNAVAVDLAQLAMWIHTFVPGLPLTFFDRNLVCGDALIGVSNIEEIKSVIDSASLDSAGGTLSLLKEDSLQQFLDETRTTLNELRSLADAQVADVEQARAQTRAIEQKLQPLIDLCNLITAERATSDEAKNEARVRLSDSPLLFTAGDSEQLSAAIASHPALQSARNLCQALGALHFPVAFPELELNGPSGFQVILGNPPWKKLKTEELRFWQRYEAGLWSLNPRERTRALARLRSSNPTLAIKEESEILNAKRQRNLLINTFDMGAGDPDLYQGFLFRYSQLLSTNGLCGIVAPRTSLSAAGMADWRRQMIDQSRLHRVDILRNTNRWAFDIHPQYSIALITFSTRRPSPQILLTGPSPSRSQFEINIKDPLALPAGLMKSLGSNYPIPNLQSKPSLAILKKMREQPDLKLFGDVDTRIVREFDMTNDRNFFAHSDTHKEGFLRVYSGKSFNIYEPDSGDYFAFANQKKVHKTLLERFISRSRNPRSAFYGISLEDLGGKLPHEVARLAIRGVTRSSDSRTLIPALVPPNTVLTNASDYFFSKGITEVKSSYLLGVLSSRVLDFYARFFIETAANTHIVLALPVPPPQEGPVSQRLTHLAGHLAAPDERFQEWATAGGFKVGTLLAPADRTRSQAELDALVALRYGLARDQLAYIFENFHPTWIDAEAREYWQLGLDFYDLWAQPTTPDKP